METAEEKAAMIDKITDFYERKGKDVKISIQEVSDRDVEMYEEEEDAFSASEESDF